MQMLLRSTLAHQVESALANIERCMQGYKRHTVTAVPYLKHHPCKKEVFMVSVVLCIIATLSHTNGQALRKVISMRGKALFMTQYLSAVVQKQPMPWVGGEQLRPYLDVGAGRPGKLVVCVPT